ncbi:MAG: nucleotide sugar dehydrogenase [Planctomycetes bacterium]|nr:nucleotide sugar dehydrogenase [Planctomycetota bacterium]
MNTNATMSESARSLKEKLDQRKALVAIVGLGYVGLPLARAMHAAGFQVLGYDRDETKIQKLKAGESYLKHLGDEMVQELSGSSRFRPTHDPKELGRADAIILCVPTPLGRHMEPDMSYIHDTTRMVAATLRKGQIISLESTTYPYTTRGECLPMLEETGLKCGADFFLVFSPEREDPGRKDVSVNQIPKLVGGVDPVSGLLGKALYGAAVQQVVLVDNAEVAESAKLLENIYRAVNIALVNELKPVFTSMGIDVWKVIEAASTKPFGFQPFFPGPGLGGHCIPIDPFYLTWKAREYGHHTRFIELAGEVNNSMPHYVVERTGEALNQQGKPLRGAKVLVCGIAYKPDIDDVRETPAAEIIHHLAQRGAEVSYHDPHVPSFPSMRKWNFDLDSVELSADRVRSFDCVVIVTHHKAIRWEMLANHARLIVDTRNVMARFPRSEAKVVQA